MLRIDVKISSICLHQFLEQVNEEHSTSSVMLVHPWCHFLYGFRGVCEVRIHFYIYLCKK
jgi:hypothetical protein